MSPHRIGIIGGSGLYELENFTGREWKRVETPFGTPSDEILIGDLGGRPVAFLPRHGRGHRLLPSEINHRANLWALKSLHVAWVIGVSAVGSLQAAFRPRDVVVVDQFVDRTKVSRGHSFFGDGIVAHVAFADPVCPDLRAILLRAARAVTDRSHDGGTYVNMEGPAFSTRAESTAYHRAGFDVIGMTNLGEARCAREAEIAYSSLAMVTDYDSWKTDEEPVTVEQIVANLHANARTAPEIISKAIPGIPEEPTFPSHDSLRGAILTDRSYWPRETTERLWPLLAKYL